MKRHRVKVVNKFVKSFGGEGAYSCSKHEWDVKRKPRVFVREVQRNVFSRVLLRGHNTGRLEKTRTPVICAIFFFACVFSYHAQRSVHQADHVKRRVKRTKSLARKKKKKKHREQQRKGSQLTRGPLRKREGGSEMNIIIIIIIITIDDGHCSSQGRRTK